MVERLVSAPKLFHSYIRKKEKGCPSVGPLMSEHGRIVSNASDISELLAHASSLVFVEGAPFSAQNQSFAGNLDEVALSLEFVVKVLSKLNSSSDGVHPHLLKACFDALSLPLYLLFLSGLFAKVEVFKISCW